MWRRIREIVRKELRQTLREPRMRTFLFVPPLVQLLLFGYAVNLDVEHSKIAWMDRDRTEASRDLLAQFEGSPYIRITHMPDGPAEVQRLLDSGSVAGVVTVLPGFSRDIERGDTAQVQVLIDGTNSNTASVVSNYVTGIVGNFAASKMSDRQRSLQMGQIASSNGDGPRNAAIGRLNASVRVWFNPDLKSRNYFVPGVVVNIITLVTLMLTAMAIVREKEIGTMEQLMVTPIRPIELMLGKTLPFAAIGLFQLLLITVAALLIFDVPFRGSPLLLLACALLYLMTTLGAGLFISTISHTQQQAMMASFFFFNPAFMLSGFAFPIRNMPLPIQYLTYLNPVRYFMEVVRGLFLKGVGMETLWPQMLCMAVFGGAVLTLSALRFHKRLD